METRLTQLINQSEIERVVNRYFQALDEKRFDAEFLAGIFAPDARVVRPNGSILVGPRAIGESHAHVLGHFHATQHIAGSFIVTPVGESETRFRANLVAMHVWAEGQGDPDVDPNENSFLAGGVLTGRVTLLANGWRIAEIANDVIWRRGTGWRELLKLVPPAGDP